MLFNNFNDMVVDIEQLVLTQKEHEKLQKEANLKALQAQINPHFLYNCLDTVHWMAKKYKADDICSMVFSLAKYFRLSTSTGKDYFKIRQVLELTESYLTAQQIRYRNKFTVKIDKDDKLDDIEIPKWLVQPLVENSIKHGIEPKKDNGEICISVKKSAGGIHFIIKDNGIGVSEEKLKDILHSIDILDKNDEANLALKNVHSQLKLYYGDDCGIKITSIVGIGTEVSFSIPMDMEGRM